MTELEKVLKAEYEADKADMDNGMDEYFKELRKEMDIIEATNNEAIEFVKQNINYDFDLIDCELKSLSEWNHIGYTRVKKSDYTSSFYKGYDFYEEDTEEASLHYMRQNEEGEFHTLDWQTVGYCEDDYSGYILFPLKDGRYWKIAFSC